MSLAPNHVFTPWVELLLLVADYHRCVPGDVPMLPVVGMATS